MPSVKDKSTIEAIAREFCSNGRIKSLALEAVGYRERYSRTCGLKLYGNIRVIEAIAKIDKEKQVKYEWNEQKALKELDDACLQAEGLRQPAVRVSSVIARNRMFGMDKDAGGKESVPPAFSPEEVEELQAMAKRATLAIKNTAKRA